MTEHELIAKQAMDIAELEKVFIAHTKLKAEIRCLLYNVGAPLNDNVLKFTDEQLRPFQKLANLVNESR